MSITGNQTNSVTGTSAGEPVQFSATNKAGFVLAILLGAVNVVSVLSPTPEGEVGPPIQVLALGTVLGLVTLIGVGVGWARKSRVAIRVGAAALMLSVLPAVPAFFFEGVPAQLRLAAAAFVLLSIVSVLMALRPAHRVNN